MADPVTNAQNQQSPPIGGENQSGAQQTPPQIPPETPPAQEMLPKELASLGFKSVKDVIGYMSEAGENARRAKTMYDDLTNQISGKNKSKEEELTDDTFIQAPKAATERVVRQMQQQHEERLTPFLNQVAEGNVAMQKMTLKADPVYGAVMPDLEEELDSYLRTIPPQLKVQENAVKTALEYVIGKNFTKVAKKYNEASARQGASTEGGSNSSGGPAGGKQQDILSEDERISAERQIKAGVFQDMADFMKWRDS